MMGTQQRSTMETAVYLYSQENPMGQFTPIEVIVAEQHKEIYLDFLLAKQTIRPLT
jgi:hypothetical protein